MRKIEVFSWKKTVIEGLLMLIVATIFMFGIEVLLLHKSVTQSMRLREINAPINFLIGLLFSLLRHALKMKDRTRAQRFLFDGVILLIVQVPIYLITLILDNSSSEQLIRGGLVAAVTSLQGGVYGVLFQKIDKKKMPQVSS